MYVVESAFIESFIQDSEKAKNAIRKLLTDLVRNKINLRRFLMLIDEQRKEQIVEVFKQVSEYQEMARGHRSTATELMKGLVESMSASKQERKTIAKILKKALKEWLSAQKGEEDTLTEAVDLLEKIS